MKENQACGNCRFWHPVWKFKKKTRPDSIRTPVEIPESRSFDSIKRHAERGLCRRYAPQASALTTVWMETRVGGWCGDYEPMGEDEV